MIVLINQDDYINQHPDPGVLSCHFNGTLS